MTKTLQAITIRTLYAKIRSLTIAKNKLANKRKPMKIAYVHSQGTNLCSCSYLIKKKKKKLDGVTDNLFQHACISIRFRITTELNTTTS